MMRGYRWLTDVRYFQGGVIVQLKTHTHVRLLYIAFQDFQRNTCTWRTIGSSCNHSSLRIFLPEMGDPGFKQKSTTIHSGSCTSSCTQDLTNLQISALKSYQMLCIHRYH